MYCEGKVPNLLRFFFDLCLDSDVHRNCKGLALDQRLHLGLDPDANNEEKYGQEDHEEVRGVEKLIYENMRFRIIGINPKGLLSHMNSKVVWYHKLIAKSPV